MQVKGNNFCFKQFLVENINKLSFLSSFHLKKFLAERKLNNEALLHFLETRKNIAVRKKFKVMEKIFMLNLLREIHNIS